VSVRLIAAFVVVEIIRFDVEPVLAIAALVASVRCAFVIFWDVFFQEVIIVFLLVIAQFLVLLGPGNEIERRSFSQPQGERSRLSTPDRAPEFLPVLSYWGA